jgi:hypothetical protein
LEALFTVTEDTGAIEVERGTADMAMKMRTRRR